MTKFVTCEYSHASYLKYGSEHEAIQFIYA